MNAFFRGLLNGVVNVLASKATGQAQPSVGLKVSIDLADPNLGRDIESQLEQDAIADLNAQAKRDFAS